MTNNDASELLRRTRVVIAQEAMVLVAVRHEDWTRLLENPELSPQPNSIFMLVRDKHEVTLLLEEPDWQVMRHAARDAKVESGLRLLTCDIELPWNVVGYLARITEILSRAGISVGVVTAFSRDHLLVHQADLPKALRVLGEFVDELC